MNFFYQEKIKKVFLTIFLLLLFCFWPLSKTLAAWIPGIDPGIRTGLEEVSEEIKGTMKGTLKQQAVNQLLSQIDNFAGGGSGGQSTFVEDWRKTVIEGPKKETTVQMNDRLSTMTRGKNTYSGYSTEGFSGPANYSADLSNSVRKLDSEEPKVTYEGDPSQMFDGRNFKKLEEWSMGINNRYMFEAFFETKQQETEENLRAATIAEKVANDGFEGVPGAAPGSVTSPGILTKEMLANAQDLPNKILASAETIPEVTAAIVSIAINRTFTQGFSSVSRANSKKDSTDKRANSNSESDNPEARFEN